MAEENTTTETPTIKPDRGSTPAEGTGRYAGFDGVLGQYRGGVHDTEAKARKAAKDAGAERITVVEV